MTAPTLTIERPGPRALARHLKRAARRRTRRTLRTLTKQRNARQTRRAERTIERRRTLAAGTAPLRTLGGTAKTAPTLITAPQPAAVPNTAKASGGKKTATPRAGAGRPCKRCNGTGVIRLRQGGKYAGAKTCPHVIAQWKKARKHIAARDTGGRK